MAVAIIGATGGIGSRVVEEILESNHFTQVKLLCRNKKSIPQQITDHDSVTIVEGSILNMTEKQVEELVFGCSTVISCLGHRLSKLFLPPYDLCRAAARRVVTAIEKNESDVKLIVVNTVGVGNPDGSDKNMRSFMQNRVLGALWLLIPPHRDNFRLSHYFYSKVGQESKTKWCVVRPDSLYNVKETDEDISYEVHNNIQVGLFNPIKTSRRNVARFMKDLSTDEELWNIWKGKYPVVYDLNQLKD